MKQQFSPDFTEFLHDPIAPIANYVTSRRAHCTPGPSKHRSAHYDISCPSGRQANQDGQENQGRLMAPIMIIHNTLIDIPGISYFRCELTNIQSDHE